DFDLDIGIVARAGQGAVAVDVGHEVVRDDSCGLACGQEAKLILLVEAELAFGVDREAATVVQSDRGRAVDRRRQSVTLYRYDAQGVGRIWVRIIAKDGTNDPRCILV